MVFVIFYSISLNAPFIQGILAFVVCIIILIMDSRCVAPARSQKATAFSIVCAVSRVGGSRFQPYQNRDLQQLATVCSFLLVVMSAVMLRSQSLISSARQINFNPQRPGLHRGCLRAVDPSDDAGCRRGRWRRRGQPAGRRASVHWGYNQLSHSAFRHNAQAPSPDIQLGHQSKRHVQLTQGRTDAST
jgi:hypothetical protein